MDNFTILINALLAGGLTAMITAGVAAYRKYKAGEIVDDDAVIARLDKDNQSLRERLDRAEADLENERRLRRAAEDDAASCRRRLAAYERSNGE